MAKKIIDFGGGGSRFLDSNDIRASDQSGGAPAAAGGTYAPRCYHSHLPLAILGGTLIGGSCIHPAHTDAYLYVGFDYGMTFTNRHWPWVDGEEMLYRITDQAIPQNPDNFDLVLGHVAKRLGEGRKVHCGCIGGHGRTGMFFAALVAQHKLADDPIAWVRERYCKKAVESQVQVDFLVSRYGCKPAVPAKTPEAKKRWGEPSTATTSTYAKSGGTGTTYKQPSQKSLFDEGKSVSTGAPVHSPTSVWGGALVARV